MDDSLSLPRRSRSLPRPTQIKIVGSAVAVIVVLLALVSLGSWVFGGTPSHNGAEQQPAVVAGGFKPTKDQWAQIKVQPVALIQFRAERVTDGKIAINSDRTTPVFSPYSGRVTKMIAKPGDFVKQGAPLLTLEASEFVQGQNDLITAAAAASKAKSTLNLAEINEKRQHELYDAKAAAQKDWQQSQADLAGARNDLRSAEIALAAVHNRLRILGKSDAEITSLEAAHQMSPEAVVSAPISGTVTDRQVGLGQYIQSGASNPVYTIGDLSTLWFIANVREQDAPSVHVGDPVEVHVLAYPGRVFKAKITYVAASIDPNTRRLPVRAELDNPDGALKPEMFASFSILTGGEDAAPGVPESGVVYEGETARVWVVKDDGSVALRPIRIGKVSNGVVEVLDGVSPGDKVVVSGALFIDRAATTD